MDAMAATAATAARVARAETAETAAAAALAEPGRIADLAAAPATPTATAAAAACRVFAVGDWSDVAIVRHQARRLAREHGIEPRRAGEVAIAVSELASNIVKHAERGEIALLVSGGSGGAGGGMVLTVQARDAGPPIHDLESAMRDGHDDRGPIDPAGMAGRHGLGTGLGAVARLADSIEVRQEAGGKQITAVFSRGLPRGA
ncbi:MAG: ATP-binding protein [Acidobacteria bacterium]|nr:ATP-binding protein [Acidobacteriota bacterium]